MIIVEALKNLSREKKAVVCGYYTLTKRNKKRVNLMKFLNALINAEGIELDTNPDFKGHKKRKLRSRITTVQFNGELIISSAFAKQMDLQPGDELEIILGRKHIRLERLEQGAIFVS